MTNSPKAGHAAWIAAMPGVFVLLWATGFIGAKLGLPYAEPFTFLTVRFVLTVAILLPVALVMRAPWPNRRLAGHIAVSGVLIHTVYLGGVFASIHRGMPAGVSALIIGLQPLVVAIAAGPLLGERVRPRQWVGFALGLLGVALVLIDRLPEGMAAALAQIDARSLAWCLFGLAGMTAATLYQKRFCGGMDLRSGAVIQFAASAVVAAPLALLLGESGVIEWTGRFVFALSWLVIVLSVGAVSLLMLLIRMGEATRVSGLFYLVPPVTALIAFFLFGERLGMVALGGMALAVLGVAMVLRR